MGNAHSHCQEAARVKELLSGESTEAKGADASNDAGHAQVAVEEVPEDGAGNLGSKTEEEEPADDEQGDGGEDEGEEPKRTITLSTAPLDPRFTSANMARACYTYYNEFARCKAELGEGSNECNVYARKYRSICPMEWLERWDALREEGRWFGKY